jgi:hypothetical protein
MNQELWAVVASGGNFRVMPTAEAVLCVHWNRGVEWAGEVARDVPRGVREVELEWVYAPKDVVKGVIKSGANGVFMAGKCPECGEVYVWFPKRRG